MIEIKKGMWGAWSPYIRLEGDGSECKCIVDQVTAIILGWADPVEVA